MNQNTGFSGQQNVGTTVATIPEFTYKRVTTAAGAEKDISGRGCIVRGIWVNTTNSQAITLYDGTTAVAVLPVGLTLGWWPLGDVGFRTSLKMTYASTGTADLTFVFKAF